MSPHHAGLERVQGPLHSHGGPTLNFHQWFFFQLFEHSRHGVGPDLLADLEKISLFLSLAPYHFIPAALSSPHALAAVEVIDLELALVVTVGIRAADLLRIVHAVLDGADQTPKSTFFSSLRGDFFLETHRRPKGAEHLPVLRNDQPPPQHVFKGRHHALVEGRSAQEHDPLADLSLSHDAIEIIVNDGITKTADEVLSGDTLLVVGDQVRLHEHRATLSQLHGPVGGQGDFLKLAHDVDAVLVGQFVEKAARAGGAHLVHVKVQGIGVGNGNIFGILSPDFEDRVNGPIDLHGASGMSSNLINDQIRIQKVAHHISS